MKLSKIIVVAVIVVLVFKYGFHSNGAVESVESTVDAVSQSVDSNKDQDTNASAPQASSANDATQSVDSDKDQGSDASASVDTK